MIIITGGAGFIGSNIIKKLNDLNKTDIIIVDNFKAKNIFTNLTGLKFTDLINYKEFIEYYIYEYNLTDIEFIIHQGACSDTTNHDTEYMLNINYEFTKKLIDICIDHKIKLIYASSAAVYGLDQHCIEEHPINIYGFSKLLIDNYARQKYDECKSSLVGLRYFNVYGFGESNKGRMASVPYHMFQQHKNGNKIQLFEGSENFYRDFIYIDDVVDITLFFALHEEQFQMIVDCGTGTPRSFQELGNIVQQNLQQPCEIKYIPFPDDLKNKYQTYTEAKLKTLNFVEYNKPFTDLETGIAKYYIKLKK